ncbi:hypothetical protein AVEN_70122-1 [Araneus ventricosus]|uniref:Uncharacterized protein n=1 Tax=Araneus ventricosus TaxID=182803 RepID=A0A4Y2EHA1_ARAVE|nr:hypothetical protein AVEN_70122-1 [Araneus ventricosus]
MIFSAAGPIHDGSSVESGFEPFGLDGETLPVGHRGFNDGQERKKPETAPPRPVLVSEILNESFADSFRDSSAEITSSTEAGVLVANHLATARPLPKKVRTITGGGAQSPTITIPTGEASSYLLIQQQLISVY